jgi:hypothetical protein
VNLFLNFPAAPEKALAARKYELSNASIILNFHHYFLFSPRDQIVNNANLERAAHRIRLIEYAGWYK